MHFAHEVTSAEPAGGGVRMRVSTTDPARKLIVRVGPDGDEALRVRARLSRTHAE